MRNQVRKRALLPAAPYGAACEATKAVSRQVERRAGGQSTQGQPAALRQADTPSEGQTIEQMGQGRGPPALLAVAAQPSSLPPALPAVPSLYCLPPRTGSMEAYYS